MALGDNGLFKKSKEAVNTWKSAEENETAVLDYLEREWNNLIKGENTKNLLTDTEVIEDKVTWTLVKEIKSPNYPHHHPECFHFDQKEVFKEDVTGIKIEFDEVFLENDDFYRFDRLSIYGKDNALECTLAGRLKRESVILIGNACELIFNSDDTNSYRGFSGKIYTTTSKKTLVEEEKNNTAKIGIKSNGIAYFNRINEETETLYLESDTVLDIANIEIFNEAYKLEDGEGKVYDEITDIYFEIFNEGGELLETINEFKCKKDMKNLQLNNVGKKIKIVCHRATNTDIKNHATVRFIQ